MGRPKRNALPNPLQAANNAARLCAAVLKLSKPDEIDRLDHWALRARLDTLRGLAETLRDEGELAGHVISPILYETGNDYGEAKPDDPIAERGD